jgi:hypothetical protein
VIRGVTPAPSIVSPSDIDEPMQTDVYEFSDVEIEEPIRQSRTRSQSRMKETSVPPAEPEKKQPRVRRTSKKPESETAPTKLRRRRAIKEEPITDDE